MGITINDTLNQSLTSSASGTYCNIDGESIEITKQGTDGNVTFDVRARFRVFNAQGDASPFHHGIVTLTGVSSLANLYADLYTAVKAKFTSTTDVFDV